MRHRATRRIGTLPLGRLTVGQLCVIHGYPVPVTTDGARHIAQEESK